LRGIKCNDCHLKDLTSPLTITTSILNQKCTDGKEIPITEGHVGLRGIKCNDCHLKDLTSPLTITTSILNQKCTECGKEISEFEKSLNSDGKCQDCNSKEMN